MGPSKRVGACSSQDTMCSGSVNSRLMRPNKKTHETFRHPERAVSDASEVCLKRNLLPKNYIFGKALGAALSC